MIKNTSKTIVLAVILFFTAGLASWSQDLKSSYFMEGSTYRHRMNPAFFNESGYINLPFFVLGNMNIGLTSNIGVQDFIYPTANGGLTTFMNSSVSSADFLGRLNASNRIGVDLNLDIISLGFYGMQGFNTIEIGLRSNTSLNLPYELFSFMKNMMTDAEGTTYNIRNLGVTTNNYLQLSLGHSHYVWGDKLSVGAKLKFLVGIANASANIDNLNLTMSQDSWKVTAEGQGYASLRGFELTADDQSKITGANFRTDQIGVSGYGAAIDLGAYFDMSDFVEGLAISASVTDLGFISWNNTVTAKMNNSFEFDGLSTELNQNSSLNDELSQIGQQAKSLLNVYAGESLPSRSTMLNAKMFIGAEYRLPMYDKVKFGILSATTFHGPHTYSEGRLVAQYAPADWFEFNINYAYSTLGSSLGWMINFHPKGFNFFIGSDHFYLGKLSPQGIPLADLKLNINFGFNITWGASKIARHIDSLDD